MRTQSSKLAEAKFNTYGSMSLIIGPNKVLINRHVVKPLRKLYAAHTGEINCAVIAFVVGVIGGVLV